MTLREATFIKRKANNFFDCASEDIEFAKGSKGFSPESEHDIIFKNINKFLEDIQFVFSINGIGFKQEN